MKRHALCLCITAVIVGFVAPPAGYAATADRIVALVGGEPIMKSDIDRAAGGRQQLSAPQIRTVLEGLVAERLLSQAARREGLRDRVTDAEIDEEIQWRAGREGLTIDQWFEEIKKIGFTVTSYRELVADRLAQREYLNQKIGSRLVVQPTEMIQYYREHLDEFRKPERRKVRMISVFFNNFPADDPARSREAARKQIDLVLKKLGENQDMAYLAREYSQDEYAANFGDWGWAAPEGSLLPPLAEKVFELKVGEISDVVATARGFHILKVEAREAAHLEAFDDVQDDIRRMLSARRREALRNDLVAQLWRRTCVELFGGSK